MHHNTPLPFISFPNPKDMKGFANATNMVASPVHDPEPNAVIVEKTAEGITTIGVNRKQKKNAVDPPTAKKLQEAFLAFDQDETQKVCVFYGIGGTFSAGFDLSYIGKWDVSTSDASNPAAEGQQGGSIARKHFEPVREGNPGPLGPTRLEIRKPVICAISGHAVAGGLELSLIADIRVMEEDAILGVFSRHRGLPLLDGGTVRLPAIVGLGRALDILLTGKTVGAQEALHSGLASRLVHRGKSFEEAMKIARQLASFAPESLNADRASCYYATYKARSLEDALENEFEKGMNVADLAIEEALRFVQRKRTRQAKL